MDASVLRTKITEYITANNTCALATGADGFIRNTPIEYSYHDGCFWMFSEGGEKFVGLEKNPNVCIAIFDKYAGFGSLKGLQVMGVASIVEPFSAEYNAHAAVKKIPRLFRCCNIERRQQKRPSQNAPALRTQQMCYVTALLLNGKSKYSDSGSESSGTCPQYVRKIDYSILSSFYTMRQDLAIICLWC